MATLNAALTLAKADDLAMLISQHLKFNVPGALNELLHVEVAISECGGSFGLSGIKQVLNFAFASNDAHAAPSTASRSFYDNGVADFSSAGNGLFDTAKHPIGAGQDGHVGFFHRLTGFFFFAHEANHTGRRPYEFDAAALANLGEVGILAEKAIPRMDGVNVGDFCRADYSGNIQIALRGARRPDAYRFIGKAHMERITVGIAVNRYSADSQLLACANHAQSNFATIGNQNFFEHARSFLLARAHGKQRLPVFHRLAVVDMALHNLAGDLGFNLVHQFHRLDNAQHLTHFNNVSRLDERRRAGRWRLIERTHDWRFHHMQAFVRILGLLRRRRNGDWLRMDHRRR